MKPVIDSDFMPKSHVSSCDRLNTIMAMQFGAIVFLCTMENEVLHFIWFLEFALVVSTPETARVSRPRVHKNTKKNF